MTDKTKRIIRIVGLSTVAVGTIAVCLAGGDTTSASGLVTLVGAAVTAIAAVVTAIVK